MKPVVRSFGRLTVVLSLLFCVGREAVNAEPAPIKSAEIPHWRAVVAIAKVRHYDKYAKEYITDDHLHLRVSHANRVVVERDLPNGLNGESLVKLFFVDGAPAGHVELWAETGTNGRDTFYSTYLLDFGPTGKPKDDSFEWGYGYEEKVIRGKRVYVAGDRNFYGRFTERVFSIEPTRVVAVGAGGFVDVSRDFPELLETELADFRKFEPNVCVSHERLAVYLADMIRLNRVDEAARFYARHAYPDSNSKSSQDTTYRDVAEILKSEGALPTGLKKWQPIAVLAACVPPTPGPSPSSSAAPGD